MEWNSRTSLRWDLENLIMFNAQATANPKKIQSTDLAIGGEEGINAWIYSSGGSGGCSDSELAMALSSKSSKSASTNSSSKGELKTSRFSFQDFEVTAEDPSNEKEYTEVKPTGISPMPEASVGYGEPLLGLKLGKRMYFEDVCVGSTAKTSSLSMIPVSSVTSAKRSNANCQTTFDQCCQVEGCNLDLSSAKDYHRKHRICESHSKCPKVIVDGLERRFCQQCSRFHGLSEFDEKKRSCRRRLSDHNARRRKLQKATVRLNPMTMSLSPCDRRQQINHIWSSVPVVHTKPNAYFTWENTNDFKLAQTSEFVFKPGKGGIVDGQLLFPSHELPHFITTPSHDSNTKGTTTEFLNQGYEESLNISTLDETQDFHRALSLLSTNTWGSYDPKTFSLHQSVHTNDANLSQSLIPEVSIGLPLASSEDWQSEPQPTKSQGHNFNSHSDSSIHFEEFQVFRSPYESGFYSGQLI